MPHRPHLHILGAHPASWTLPELPESVLAIDNFVSNAPKAWVKLFDLIDFIQDANERAKRDLGNPDIDVSWATHGSAEDVIRRFGLFMTFTAPDNVRPRDPKFTWIYFDGDPVIIENVFFCSNRLPAELDDKFVYVGLSWVGKVLDCVRRGVHSVEYNKDSGGLLEVHHDGRKLPKPKHQP